MLRILVKNQKDGFASIVEVIVTSVIFVLATAGILSTVAMLRPHGHVSSEKVEAIYIGKGILDDLRRQVDASTWYNATSNLALGTYGTVIGNYTVSYNVIATGNPDLRQLDMTVTWPDP